MKLHIYITDPVAFAKGDFQWCFAVYGKKIDWKSDLYAGSVEVKIDIDRQKVVRVAREALNAEEDRVRNKLNAELSRIEQARQELRAIPHLEAIE